MTAAAISLAPRGRYHFRHVAAMEWIKLRTLRSTWWTLAITVAGAIAMAIVIGLNTKYGSADLTNNALAGVIPGLLLTGVLGVMIMTSEFTSGLIRATLAAVPNRPLALAAKAAVFGGVTLVLGEAATFIAFLAGGAALRHGIPAPTLAQPGVLRAVVMSGASFSLIGLLGLGLGAIVRHTAAAIGVLVGGVDPGTTYRRAGSRCVRLPAHLNHRELAQHDQAGNLRGRCRRLPAPALGVDGARRAVPVCGRGPCGRRLAAVQT